jgi:LysR family transcriptional regulator for metE and metH
MKEKLNPDLRRVTLKHLRALSAVVNSGTVSGAAEQLGVTPPAVSLHMRHLAEAAGMPLIDRTGAGAQPTEAGRELLETANRIESAFEECAAALRALQGVEGGHVFVGVISTAKYFAPRALAAFREAHAQVELRLSIGNRSETIAALKDYKLDFAVMGRPPDEFDVESAVIGDHPHIIIAAPDHTLANSGPHSITDLSEESFLPREEGSGTRLLMERLFAQQGLQPKLGMQIASNETIKQAVMAKLGIALISAHTVATELADGRLIRIDVKGLPVMRQWFVVRRREKHLLPAAQALWDFLTTDGAAYLPKLADRRTNTA